MLLDHTEWEIIPNTKNNYLVSRKGEVWSVRSGRELRLSNNKGYKVVNLGRGKQYKVHRLVLSTFDPVGNWESLQVNHIDGDKTNNALSNLEWCTGKENIHHANKTGLNCQKGSGNNASKLIEPQVRCIKQLLKEGKYSISEIAKMFLVNRSTIERIKNGKLWKHVEL